ncbi:MAG: glycosyltransferase [Heteroscytonema crispum UTEX LB 1556]
MNLKPKIQNSRREQSLLDKTPLLLLVWLAIGIFLRLANLTAKPPWTDEFSTLVFSLGNSFLGVPLDQAIAPDILLQPLQPQAAASIKDVWTHLSSESNHPPLYFILTHLWLRLFPTEGGLVSLWGARSLAAILGAFSIPAIYALSWISFRSRLVSHLAAAMMAVSPYAIFLAQEARHYTLAILWVIASLACFVITTRHIQNRRQLPIWVALSWVVINALGIASHYFFALTLCAEAIVLIFLAWQQWREGRRVWATGVGDGCGDMENISRESSSFHPPLAPQPQRQSAQVAVARAAGSFVGTGSPPSPPPPLSPSPHLFLHPWRRIYAVAAGTFIAGVVWIPVFLHNSYGGKLTEWIQGPRQGIAWISPIFQALAAWITMICLLPVESPQIAVMVLSGVLMLIFFIWATPILVRGFKIQLQQPETRFTTQVFAGLIVGAIALFFILTYFFGIDLTRGARYNFVYFPAVMVLVGASLAVSWNTLATQIPDKNITYAPSAAAVSKTKTPTGKTGVAIIWLMGFLSGITVNSNLGYQKYYRPDLFVQLIEQTSRVPILIATTQKTHVHIGEMMGVAREFKIQNSNLSSSPTPPLPPSPPLFLLAHQDIDPNTSAIALQNTLKKLPRPLDLWLTNFFADEPEEVKSCVAETKSLPAVNGYQYKLYHCN